MLEKNATPSGSQRHKSATFRANHFQNRYANDEIINVWAIVAIVISCVRCEGDEAVTKRLLSP